LKENWGRVQIYYTSLNTKFFHFVSGGNEGFHFTVQLEVLVNNVWRVVIRYDVAHGFAHIDRYYLGGRKVKKELHLKLGEALTLADEDIKENWKAYQEEFLEGE
jgi:hypothetical protein